jgi:hypothetical protein
MNFSPTVRRPFGRALSHNLMQAVIAGLVLMYGPYARLRKSESRECLL